MSYTSLSAQIRDGALCDRVNAAAHQEAFENPAVADTAYAELMRTTTMGGETQLIWPVSVATEAEYESALAAGNSNPGGDPAVISDQAILSATQANWPPDPA